jgi:hypothetical protein
MRIEDEVLGLYPMGNPFPPLHGVQAQAERWRRNWSVPVPGVVQTRGAWPWSGKWGLPVVTPNLTGLDGIEDDYGFFWAIPAVAAAIGTAASTAASVGTAAATVGGTVASVAGAVKKGRKKGLTKAQTRALIQSNLAHKKQLIIAAKARKRARRRKALRRKRHETGVRVGESRARRTRVSKLRRDPRVIEQQMEEGADRADAAMMRTQMLRAPGDPRLARLLNVPPRMYYPAQAQGGPMMPWYSKPLLGGMPTGTAMLLGVVGVGVLLLATRGRS